MGSGLQQPENDDPRAWEEYWLARNQQWRKSPEISVQRQLHLTKCLQTGDVTNQNSSPFANIRLHRGDIEWLLIKHYALRVKWKDGAENWWRGNNIFDYQWWLRVRMNLGGANLSGIDLSGLDLNYVRLHQTNLENANLCSTNLDSVDFSNANLQGAKFADAYFFLTNMSTADLRGVDLAAMRLTANFDGAALDGANLSYADARGCSFIGAKLIGVNLSHTILRHANLTRADLTDAILEYADVCFSTFRDATLIRARIQGTEFESGWTTVGDADIQGVIWNPSPPNIGR